MNVEKVIGSASQPNQCENRSFLNQVDAIFRRMFDIVASFAGLIVFAPIFLVVAIAIKKETPGPVFFRGSRIGKSGNIFKILKFRTMYEHPESYTGPKVTGAGDIRITPLGQWLRDTKINELPQLWNVLIGDMSFVGPRPEDPEIVKGWTKEQKDWIFSVRPGVTSPATVIFREEEKLLTSATFMDDYLCSVLPDKLRIDCLYLRRRNFFTDIDIIFMTVLLLLPVIKKTQVPESFLYFGPICRFLSRNFSWFVIDTVTAFLAIVFSGLIWRANSVLNLGYLPAILMAVVISFIFSIVNGILGLDRISWSRARSSDVFPLTVSCLLTTLMIVLSNFLLAGSDGIPFLHTGLPTGLIIFTGLLALIGFIGTRYRTRLLTGMAWRWVSLRRSKRVMGERVLLIGAGANSHLATWMLTHSDLARFFNLVGVLDDDPRKQGLKYDGLQVLGTTRDVKSIVRDHQIGLIVYTIENIEYPERARIIRSCSESGARLLLFPDLMVELRRQFLEVNNSNASMEVNQFSSSQQSYSKVQI